jgi:hypothetical protein
MNHFLLPFYSSQTSQLSELSSYSLEKKVNLNFFFKAEDSLEEKLIEQCCQVIETVNAHHFTFFFPSVSENSLSPNLANKHANFVNQVQKGSEEQAWKRKDCKDEMVHGSSLQDLQL